MSIVYNLGMPYMGSKRKLSYKIVNTILELNPNCKYLYDLFGGGGAVSFYALQTGKFKKVVYNEINTGVVELLKKIRDDGITDEFLQWVDRETFFKHKNDNDWFGGLCKVVWSFGNMQQGYMFGKDIEDIKKQAHNYLIENGYKIGDKEKRIKLIKQFKNDKKIKGRFELEQLERLERLQQLQQLERLERLQQLEQLEQLQQLEIQNKSYEEVKIETPINETIIYCDIPYKNTGEYQNVIDYDKFFEWVRNSKYKIYISSYDFPLYEVEEFVHRCTLSNKANNKVYEKLFCNKKDKLYLFDGVEND